MISPEQPGDSEVPDAGTEPLVGKPVTSALDPTPRAGPRSAAGAGDLVDHTPERSSGESLGPALDVEERPAASVATTSAETPPSGPVSPSWDYTRVVEQPKRHVGRPHFGRSLKLRPVRMNLRVHTLDSMRYRNFRLLWAATLCASGGYWVYTVVIGWLAYDLTRSPLLTALAQGLDHLPFLLVAPLAGVLADAWDRRKIVASVAVYQAAVMAAFAVVVFLGRTEPWHILAFVLAIGLSWTITETAKGSILPNIVPRHNLVNAIALNALAFNITRLGLPAVAGIIIAWAGPGSTLMLAVALFIVAIWAALALRLGSAGQPEARRGPVLASFVEAARYLRAEPSVLRLLLLGMVPPMLIMPFVLGLMPVYAAEVFGGGSASLGFLVSALGGGAALGSLLLATKGEFRNKGRALLVALALVIVSMALFSATRSLALAIPALMLFGGSLMWYWSVLGVSIQMVIPDGLRGRITALGVMSFGFLPVGSLLAGIIAELVGAPLATLIGAATVTVLLAILSLRFRRMWSFQPETGPLTSPVAPADA